MLLLTPQFHLLKHIVCYKLSVTELSILVTIIYVYIVTKSALSPQMQVLVLGFLFTIAQQNSATQFLYVLPTEPTTVTCPDQPCNMLSYYVHHTCMLTSNSTLHFLPGVHVLGESTVLVVRKINNFTISGERHNESIVLCADNAGFIFTDILGLTVKITSAFYIVVMALQKLVHLPPLEQDCGLQQ